MATSLPLPRVFACRHGETAWTLTGQHTGRTDIPLTEIGEKQTAWLRQRLEPLKSNHVFTSPSKRARRTAALVMPGANIVIDEDLAEWDYGQFEGLRSAEIRAERPDWQLFRDGCPGGESLVEISARADRVISRLRAIDADVAIFSSGHITRVIAARWLGLDVSAGRCFTLGTASLSILGYEHARDNPAILLWNERETIPS